MVYDGYREEGSVMIRIGEVAKLHGISNRTLRHWEEAGVLVSVRAENGYRYYDEGNVERVQHIMLLRKLKMPIGDIEKLFDIDDTQTAIKMLGGHLANLRQKTAVYATLSHIVENIIGHIQQSESISKMLQQLAIVDANHLAVPKTILSEGIIAMETLKNVRIVDLPPMTVVSHCMVSESPEKDCSDVFDPFIAEYNLRNFAGYRNFGFNNPDPCESRPQYGYELWAVIADDFAVPDPFVKKHFEGGLYASISANMNEIGERWEALYNWSTQNNKYEGDFDRQWLEELVMKYEDFASSNIPDSEKQLDLLFPIKPK